MRAVFSFTATLLLVAVLSGGVITLHRFKVQERVLPRTYVANLYLGGLTRSAAKALLHAQIESYLTKPIQLAARGEVREVTMRQLGVSIDEPALFNALPVASDLPNVESVVRSIAGQRTFIEPRISAPTLLQTLYTQFPSLPKPQNAHFVKQGGAFVVVEGTPGVQPKTDLAVETLEKSVAILEHATLFVEFEESAPTVTKADLDPIKATLVARFQKKIKFLHEKQGWDVDFAAHPEVLDITRVEDPTAPASTFSFSWAPLAFAEFVNGTLVPKLEQPAEDVRMWTNEEKKVQFEGRGTQGRSIDQEALLAMANVAINSGLPTVDVPLVVVEPRIDISEDLQALGIHELIAVGYTRFEGSPVNRSWNIGVGVSKFNGVLIPQGEDFSFGKNIGAIDGTTGYKKELVIKPEGTIPEYGGGVCQVSSTIYRAALFAGLPIKKRSPHSYAVGYYAQILGHGLDATVYPPQVDLVFANDTPGAIVVQSYVDGPSAYFKFYGTKDDRTVAMEGPFISNKRGGSTVPILAYDPSLNPGQTKVIEKAHGGFDALWYRNMTKNGVTTKEEIVSKYRATQNKILTGDKPQAVGTSTEAVNPLE